MKEQTVMKNNTSRIIIETMLRKALKDVKDSPERSTRNLVDMALQFSEGRFQRNFFSTAQTMLQNEHSSYYGLVKDIAANVDSEKIVHFGMNLGYNSCTAGAAQIREAEESCGYNIPWCVGMALDSARLTEEPEAYDQVITQGEKLGIYTWMLFGKENLLEVLPLVQAHPDDAFILFCEAENITTAFLDAVSEADHLMLAVQYAENDIDVYDEMRGRQLLYSAWQSYTDRDVEEIVSGDFFDSVQQIHPVFTALAPSPDCSKTAKEKVCNYVEAARNGQTFQTVPWELLYDNSRIDSIISNDPVVAFFDVEGYLYMQAGSEYMDSLNLFKNDLSRILERAFVSRSRL
ncbi:MAG: hypothetical protein LUH00_09080 [Lachnospiraceae bacterium]|nr:hypothetical protein [Lachnospiraceae bacterium]